MRTMLSILTVAALVALGAGPAAADFPVNPILNDGFELYAQTVSQLPDQPVLNRGNYVDGAIWWSEGFGSNARFPDLTGDGDREAVLDPTTDGMHNMWQSVQPPLQVVSENFQSFEFTVEAGAISPAANNQIGFSLSPAFSQHPYVGIFWEGAVMFRADDMVPDAEGRVRLNPVEQGEIVCPTWPPCDRFKAAFDAADDAGKARLLGQARIVQVSFWYFNYFAAAPVAIDNVAITGVTSVAEELASGNVTPP